MSEQKQRRALLSVYDKNINFEDLVRALHASDYELIASGGTFRFIDEKMNLPVTPAASITRLRPVEGKENVLDHRVETLCPELHGGLLADEHLHMAELAKLGWPFIDMLVSTFYPLAKTMEEKFGDFEAINDQVDIGGPALVRSACKGGRIVVVDQNDFGWFIKNSEADGNIPQADIKWLHLKAAAWVAQYVATEVVFRTNQTRPE